MGLSWCSSMMISMKIDSVLKVIPFEIHFESYKVLKHMLFISNKKNTVHNCIVSS